MELIKSEVGPPVADMDIGIQRCHRALAPKPPKDAPTSSLVIRFLEFRVSPHGERKMFAMREKGFILINISLLRYRREEGHIWGYWESSKRKESVSKRHIWLSWRCFLTAVTRSMRARQRQLQTWRREDSLWKTLRSQTLPRRSGGD